MKLYSLFVGLFLAFEIFAQIPSAKPQNTVAYGSISGYVFEKGSNQAIEYANLIVYSKRDSSIVTGGITDKNGYFKINNIAYGKYFFEVNFIGYGKSVFPDLNINSNKKDINLGKIYLSINAEMLEEVSIEANVNQVDYKLDRKIVNVNQDIIAAGATAVEVLENVPSVTTDIDGNVSLRGSESFMVLIDGRPSPLEGSEALQQIPASSIESIEIITNPSAKYDADGSSGIINVVLKKDKRAGWNGQVSANYGTFNTRGVDGLVNIRTNKINYFFGGEYSVRNFSGDGYIDKKTFLPNNDEFILNTITENSRNRNTGSFRTGLDYYLTENDIITVSGKLGFGSYGSTSYSKAENWYGLNDSIANHKFYVSDGWSDSRRKYFSADMNYMKKFNGKGHELQIYANFSGSYNNSINYYNTFDSNNNYQQIDDSQEYRTIEDGVGKMFLAKVDYVYPINEKGKLETGYQLRTALRSNDYNYQTMYSEWISDASKYNPYTFNMNIQSGYLVYSNYFKTLGYQVGLRTEYTDRVFLQTETNQEWTNKDQNKFDFFPSVHLSYQLPADMQVLASYSRRLERPQPWYLNPFREVVDPNTVRVGNPELGNEYINSYDLSFQKKFKTNFVSLEAYYRETNNKINRINEVDDEHPDIFISSFDNIGKDKSLGAELMANLNLTKWYNLNVSGTGYYYQIIANSNQYNSNSSMQWNTRINNTFKFKKSGTSFQFGAFFNGPRISAQAKFYPNWAANAGLKQDFFNRTLSLSLNVRNAFRTMKMESISETNAFYQHFLREPRGPVFTFSVTYKINDFKTRKEKGFNNEEGDRNEDDGM